MHNTDEIRLFSERVQKGLCSHAYIVDGDNGIGKLDFAMECAKAVLCTGHNQPCGYCNSCQKVRDNNHPDIHIIGRDKTGSIADVRELIRKSGLKPNDGEKQVFIVCNANKLRADSQNALLKLFEEPPKSVVIFLLTDSRSSLLPTVLSRGQRIHLDGMRDIEITNILLEKYPKISKTELENALFTANGNLGVAEKFLSKDSINLRTKAEELLNLALDRKNYEVSALLLVPKYKREQLSALLVEFIKLVTEIQKQRYGIYPNMAPKSGECAKKASSASKKALAHMGEAAFICMAALENNANVTAAATKFTVDLLHAATK